MVHEAGGRSGIDAGLRTLVRAWRLGWEEARQWPAFAWTSPAEPVRVVLPDGSETVRLGPDAVPAPEGATPRAVAVVLPDDLVLVRELSLPRLTAGELREALALDLATASPFAPEDTVWGWRSRIADGRLAVRLALASRAHVADRLAQEGHRLGGAEPEVWADAEAPVVLGGYGEPARLGRLARERTRIAGAAAIAALLVLALAATPLLQAEQRLARLEAEVAELVAVHDALLRRGERARALRTELAARADPLRLFETLSVALPDDAWLTRLELDGRQVRMAGQASDAARLMDKLGARPAEFREMRAPAPISRDPGADTDSFALEFVLAPPEGSR